MMEKSENDNFKQRNNLLNSQIEEGKEERSPLLLSGLITQKSHKAKLFIDEVHDR